MVFLSLFGMCWWWKCFDGRVSWSPTTKALSWYYPPCWWLNHVKSQFPSFPWAKSHENHLKIYQHFCDFKPQILVVKSVVFQNISHNIPHFSLPLYNGWFDASDPSFILAQHGPPLHSASGRPLVMVPVLSNTAQFNAETFSQTVASCDFVNLGDLLVGFHRLKWWFRMI